MTQTRFRYVACWVALVAVAACAVRNEMPQPSEGAEIFADNCTACHGYRGDEQGVLVGGQTAPDLTKIAARNGGTFPRAEVLSQIDGYKQGTHADRIMPEFGARLNGETVPIEVDGVLTPTPRSLAALLAYLEDIQQ